MITPGTPFTTTRWDDIRPTEHSGDTGVALWHTSSFGDSRVRQVHYSAGYRADHWCSRGHLLYVVAGTLTTELEDGRIFVLEAGDSYQVSNDTDTHRSRTETGATLFIID